MAKNRGNAAVMDIEDQREMASSISPLAAAVENASTQYRDPNTGKTAQIGRMDPGKAQGRARDYQFEQRISIIKRRHAFSNIPACTILNFLPVQLKVNSPIPELSIAVPPATRIEPFTYYTWHEPIIQTDRVDERTIIPTDFVPAQLGEEFMREYKAGGVMVIQGTIKDLNMDDPKVAKLVEDTQEQAFTWMSKMVSEAWNYWNTPNHGSSGNITDIHRTCAQILFDNGRLGNTKPTWMELVRSQDEVLQLCPSCRSEVKPHQIVCTNPGCGKVLDVRGAFESQEIDEFDLRLEHQRLCGRVER
jgi:hypothetical protein